MLRPGDRIAHYRVVEEIGRGGMSRVYLVVDEHLQTERALKELSDFYSTDEAWRDRFHDEAILAASLDDPRIVTVHDHLVVDDLPYIVMEYVPWGSVRELVRAGLDVEQIVGLVGALLDGLTTAESAGITHRDLKPDNLLRTRQGSIKITDFGIATTWALTEKNRTPPDIRLGNAYYIAPEIAEGGRESIRSDLYSVGVIAYELLRGRPPFARSANFAEVVVRKTKEDTIPMRVAVPDLDIRIGDWVDRLLARVPGKRFGSAAEAREALEAAADAGIGPGWRASRLPSPDETPIRPPAAPTTIESRFVGLPEIRRMLSPRLPRHVISVISWPPTLAVIGLMIAAAAVREVEWLYAAAAIVFVTLVLLRFFDAEAVYRSRGIRAERIKKLLREWFKEPIRD